MGVANTIVQIWNLVANARGVGIGYMLFKTKCFLIIIPIQF